jgi:uracil-DNA glycosylase
MEEINKENLLSQLKEKMSRDESLPLKKGATNLVFGAGDANTNILCIGEGPGYWEDLKGEPFVGNAGKLLDQLLVLSGLERKKVYITNVVHHRPPENRDPLPNEIEAYGKYLDEIIEIIDPKIILTLGRFSMGKFLPNATISAVHGRVYNVDFRGSGITVIPMYHPAASLRNPEVMRQEKEDFLKLKDFLEKPKKEEKKDDLVKKEIEQMNLI